MESLDTELLERFISAELDGRKHPGSSVSIIKGDQVVWSKGFGYADIRKGTLVTPDTVYGCASVTKPVVTTGFLQLMEQGKFNLNDDVNKHLDIKIKNVKGEEPKIKDLLTHHTGMPTRVPPLFLLGEKPLDMRSYIDEAAKMVRPRGESWAYCNTAFTIVGYLIEQFTGLTYDQYIKEHVLKPLEMTSSDFELSPKILDNLAQGYKRPGGPDKELLPNPLYVLGTKPADPAGSLYSNVLDLAKFVIMNMNGGVYKGKRLLKEETIRQMHSLQAPTSKSRSGMGLTWFRTIHDGQVMLYHTGGLPDYTNHVCFYPEKRIGVCWMSNLQDGSGWRPPAPTALRIAVGEALRNQANIQLPPTNWEKIVGTYGDETHKSTIRVINGFMTLDDYLQLERVDDTRYTVHGPTSDGDELTFEYGENGLVEKFDLNTSFYPRYKPETFLVDVGLDLNGVWVGEYYNSYGFHKLELIISDRHNATVKDPQGEVVTLMDFRAELGQVTGHCKFRIPVIYARWRTSDWIETQIELKAIDGKLKGVLKTEGESDLIELIKT